MSEKKRNNVDEEMTPFTFNVSKRTKRELDEICDTQKTAVGSILRKLANEYVTFGVIAERRKEISLPREILGILIRNMSEEDLKDFVDTYYNIARNDLELRYPVVDCKKIQNGLLAWAKFSDHNFNIIKDRIKPNEFWITTKHELTINWSNALELTITKLLEEKNNCLVLKEDTIKTETLLKMHYRMGLE
ncbi:hypothetical protein K0U27_01445 [archaeon]|nr:hypothetical protein [archaeon]